MAGRTGQALRRLRAARGWTLEQTSKASGVSVSALNRWETGVNQPRLPELEAVLTALGAAPRQRQQILEAMQAPRAVTAVRSALHQAGEEASIGPMPHGGDLLRALRLRRGLSLEAVAAHLGITTRTLRLWEKAEVWPAITQRHALCLVLGAGEDEVIALTAGPFSDPRLPQETVSQEALRATLTPRLRRASNSPHWEMELLALEAQVWPFALRNADGRDMLSRVLAHRADILSVHERWGEVQRYTRRAFDLLPRKPASNDPVESFHWAAVWLADAHAAVYGGARPAPARGLSLLRPALAALASVPDWDAWVRSRVAEYLVLSGAVDEGLSLATKTFRAAQHSEDQRQAVRRRMDRMSLALIAGRPAEALPLLDVPYTAPSYERAGLSLVGVEALLELGKPSEAHDWLQRAQADLARPGTAPHLKERADALAARL